MTVRIEETLVHCILDGKLIKSLPRTHTKEISHLPQNKKHRSRRAADAARRQRQAGQDQAE